MPTILFARMDPCNSKNRHNQLGLTEGAFIHDVSLLHPPL